MTYSDALLQGGTGLASVVHDATPRRPKARRPNPLGVADDGIGSAQIAAGAVTSAEIDDFHDREQRHRIRARSTRRGSTPSASIGQVLTVLPLSFGTR